MADFQKQTVQWFPGHMAKTRRIIKESLNLVDGVVELVDSRIPYSSSNPELNNLIKGKPRIVLLNKCDIAENIEDITYPYSDSLCVKISAQTGMGIDDLMLAIEKALPQTRKRVNLLLPFDKAGLAAKIRNTGVIHSEEYIEQGLFLDCTAEISFLDTIKDYIV